MWMGIAPYLPDAASFGDFDSLRILISIGPTETMHFRLGLTKRAMRMSSKAIVDLPPVEVPRFSATFTDIAGQLLSCPPKHGIAPIRVFVGIVRCDKDSKSSVFDPLDVVFCQGST